MKIEFDTYSLKLKSPFGISRGTRSSVASFIIIMEWDGIQGFGEATVNPYYKTTIEDFESCLIQNKSLLMLEKLIHPTLYWDKLRSVLGDSYFLICALDQAYWDVYAQVNQATTRSFFGYSNTRQIQTSYTIGLDNLSVMLDKMLANPWPIYKIKLGGNEDLQILRELRKQTDAVFRVDPNGGWTVDQLLSWEEELCDLGVEFIEQPLPAENWEGSKIVYEKCNIPILADESCLVEEDVRRCTGYFHGINIKLMKCGGITPALRMIDQAQKCNLKLMMGCMTESSIGISAIAQFLDALDYVDMDGALLLSNDPAFGVRLENGNVIYSDRLGSGGRLA